MNLLRQIYSLTRVSLKSLSARIGSASIVIIGVAGVVCVLVSVLAMSTGMQQVSKNSGRDDRVIVMSDGADTEVVSSLSREVVHAILNAPGLKRGRDGEPIASAEVVKLISIPRKSDGAQINILLRGIGPHATELRPRVSIIRGRMFQPGLNEIVVGTAALAEYEGLNIGSRIATRDATWTVVGIFQSDGDIHEAELFADADLLATQQGNSGWNSVTLQLASAASFTEFSTALASVSALDINVMRESAYYAAQSAALGQLSAVFGY